MSDRNPFIWDESADFIKSKVLTLAFTDSEGSEIDVKNTPEPFIIDINTDDSNRPIAISVKPKVRNDEPLMYTTAKIPSNQSSLHIIIFPQDGSPDVPMDVYVRHDRLPTLEEYDLFVKLPRDPNKDDLDKDKFDDQLVKELEHTVFISPEHVQKYGSNGVYYIGIRPSCKYLRLNNVYQKGIIINTGFPFCVELLDFFTKICG